MLTRFMVNQELVLSNNQENAIQWYKYFYPGVPVLKCYWLDEGLLN